MGRSLHRELVPPKQLAFAPQIFLEEVAKGPKESANKGIHFISQKIYESGPVDQIPINIRTGLDTIVLSELVADVLPN